MRSLCRSSPLAALRIDAVSSRPRLSALAADLLVGVMTDDTSSRTCSCRDRDRQAHRQGRGFKVIRRRWVIERTFSWLRPNRRLMAHYDVLAMVAVGFAKLAMISLMLKRLTSAYP
jgi:transposase